MQMVVNKEKKELRERLLKRLLSLTESEIKRRSKNVEEKLSILSLYKEAKTIMVYYPIKGEVDILGLIRKDNATKRFCFPVMDLEANNLRIHEVKNLEEDFILGPYGVKEPDTTKTKELDFTEIDMIIVPGLAFDQSRNRLGRGGGFYDRFLSQVGSYVRKVGIAFNFQILETLPADLSLDQKVDVVIGEDEIV